MNEIILSFIAMALIWVIRRLKLDVEGVAAVWLTAGVSVVLAVIQLVIEGGFPSIITCALDLLDPMVALACLLVVAKTILAQAGVIFGGTKIIYELLRRKIRDRTILGHVVGLTERL